jgi:hypothetical protein
LGSVGCGTKFQGNQGIIYTLSGCAVREWSFLTLSLFKKRREERKIDTLTTRGEHRRTGEEKGQESRGGCGFW